MLSLGNHFAEQADRHELDPDDDENEPHKEEGPIAEGRLTGGPFRNEVSVDAYAGEGGNHSPQPEQMKGPCDIASGKQDGEQIEKSFEKSPRSEFCLAKFSGPVLNDNLADPEPLPVRKGRNVAVQLALDVDTFHNIAAVRFQSAVGVMNFHSCHYARHEIEELRRNRFRDWVVAFLLPSGNNIVSGLDLSDQIRNFRRVILQIGIHRYDVIALRALEADHERCAFPVVPAKPDDLDPVVTKMKVAENAE